MELIQGHKFCVDRKLKESDLVTRLAFMTKEEVNAIMCSSKLLQLGTEKGVCSKENGWKNVDLAHLGAPYTPFSCQVIF